MCLVPAQPADDTWTLFAKRSGYGCLALHHRVLQVVGTPRPLPDVRVVVTAARAAPRFKHKRNANSARERGELDPRAGARSSCLDGNAFRGSGRILVLPDGDDG